MYMYIEHTMYIVSMLTQHNNTTLNILYTIYKQEYSRTRLQYSYSITHTSQLAEEI